MNPDALELLASEEAKRAGLEVTLREAEDLPFVLTREHLQEILSRAKPSSPAPAASAEVSRQSPAEPPGPAPAAAAPAPEALPVVVPADGPPTPLAPARAPLPEGFPLVPDRPAPPDEPPRAARRDVSVQAIEEAEVRDPRPAYGQVPRGAAVPDDPDEAGPADAARGAVNVPVGGGVRRLDAEVAFEPRSLPGMHVGTVVPVYENPVEFTAPLLKGLPAYAHEYEIRNDITGVSTCEGDIHDFTRYFMDRLRRIRRLFRQRREMRGAVPIKSIRSGVPEVRFVAIVSSIRTTKNGHRLLEVEDETGNAVVLALASDERAVEFVNAVVEDEVVGIVAKPSNKGDLLILQSLVRPDVPFGKESAKGKNASAVAFISDIHFGARTFLDDDWERFVRWITGQHPDKQLRALAERTKYLVVVGDVAEGIGIFPGQEDELTIADGHEQYAHAGREFQRILDVREDMRIVVLPGNHDLVRPAEPQPSLPEKYRKLMPSEIRHVGNPCRVVIEGVDILAYHGRSFDDWILRVQGLSYERPVDAMIEMMKRRHVLPMYGLRTPVAPEAADYLVIEQVPDVFITGHVHAVGMQDYRGVTLINSSCWQGQTSYQKMHGFNPEPGKVPVIDLDTSQRWLLDFHRGAAGVDRFGVGPSHADLKRHEAKHPPGTLSF